MDRYAWEKNNVTTLCYYADDNALNASSRGFHQIQEYLNQDFKILGTDSMIIIWSIILVNVNLWALDKQMEVRYLLIMESDFEQL